MEHTRQQPRGTTLATAMVITLDICHLLSEMLLPTALKQTPVWDSLWLFSLIAGQSLKHGMPHWAHTHPAASLHSSHVLTPQPLGFGIWRERELCEKLTHMPHPHCGLPYTLKAIINVGEVGFPTVGTGVAYGGQAGGDHKGPNSCLRLQFFAKVSRFH